MEEGRDGQSGDDDGDAIVMADDTPQESLQANHQAKVNHGQHRCQCTVNQRAIDKNIDVPEPRAQDSEGNGERDEEHQEVDGSEDDPFALLALQLARHAPIAVDLSDHHRPYKAYKRQSIEQGEASEWIEG